MLSLILAVLCLISLLLTLWQWAAARRFPLHQRIGRADWVPSVTLLKPLKEADLETGVCLESWLVQDYPGPVQVLFGVSSADDPACEVVRELMVSHPGCDATLVVCPEVHGANTKVSTLVQLERRARHDVIVVSDADVVAPPDLLINLMAPLRDPQVGLVHCFYRLANPTTAAMRCEAVSINADFWTQVLQSRSLKRMDFALGAVMATPRQRLEVVGGFAALADYLADDYHLGNRIARSGGRIEMCPVVVECRESPQGWREVWRHQLRWARTIRFCRPLPYFLSVLGNATLWPLLWLLGDAIKAVAFGTTPPLHFGGGGLWFGRQAVIPLSLPVAAACLVVRVATALRHQSRLARAPVDAFSWWLAPVKDLFSAAIWGGAFLGNRVSWRGQRHRVLADGRLARGDGVGL